MGEPTTTSAPAASRRPRLPHGRRRWLWLGVATSAALIAVGTVMAVDGYRDQADPASTARGYFAAVARADAPAALGYGDVPDGNHSFLTSDVLKQQRRIAPINGVSVLAVERAGNQAKVTVQYSLTFADATTVVSDRIQMVRHAGRWRLDTSAVVVDLLPSGAQYRLALAGAGMPSGQVVLFPGALPLTVDTPNLAIDEKSRAVLFNAPGAHPVNISVSDKGRRAVDDAIDKAVAGCLAGTSNRQAACPLPTDDRAIPGTLRGEASEKPSAHVSLRVTDDVNGQIAIDGTAAVTGSYSRLTFDNIAETRTGAQDVSLAARCYASAPQTVAWGQT